MSSSLSPSTQFFEESSSSDNSNKEDLHDDDIELMVVLLAVKELGDRKTKKQRGSKVGRLCIPWNRMLNHNMRTRDYFAKVPTYLAHLFRSGYRMWQSLFVKIVEACEANACYFTRRRNATDLIGFNTYQRISTTMRVIAYGIQTNYVDEYHRIGEDTHPDCV
jgi:hypothetical protein